MLQKFIAREPFTFSNGAIGWRPGGPFDCLGPYAKVERCPIHGTDLQRTCYATGYADTWFSVPAVCKVRGKRVTGYLSVYDGAISFRPYVGQLPYPLTQDEIEAEREIAQRER